MFRTVSLQILPKGFLWNMTAFISELPLKENALWQLKSIKSCNNALEFCHLLYDAKMLIHKPKSICRDESSLHPFVKKSLNKDDLVTNLIFFKLRDMIHKDKPEYFLADTILEAMRILRSGHLLNQWTESVDQWTESRQRLILLFLNTETFQYRNHTSHIPKECLNNFIDDIECFIRLNKNKGGIANLISQTKGLLKMLEYLLFQHVCNCVGSLPYTVQRIIDIKCMFSKEEEIEYQTLMSEVVSQILTLLFYANRASKSVVQLRISPASTKYEVEIEKSCVLFTELIKYCYITLEKVPLYHMTLKEKLLKYSKDGISCHNASKFCKILSELESSFKSSGVNSLNTDLAICHLRDIINAEKPEYNLVNMILVALQSSTVPSSDGLYDGRNFIKVLGSSAPMGMKEFRKASDLMLLLLSDDGFNFLESKFNNSKEFLMHFIEELRYFIDLCEPTGENDLENSLDYNTKCNTEFLLNTILKIYLSKLQFSNEEQRKFGSLMSEAIELISEYNCDFVSFKIKSSLLRRRSSLQFFKDFCCTISANGETPLKAVDLSKLDRQLQNFDESITRMCDYSANRCNDFSNDVFSDDDCSDEDCSDDDCSDDDCSDDDCSDGYISADVVHSLKEEDVSDLENAGASKMPKSHTWWAKCLKVLDEKKL